MLYLCGAILEETFTKQHTVVYLYEAVGLLDKQTVHTN